MGNHQEGGAQCLTEFQHELLNTFRGMLIQVTGRLVQQDTGGLVDQSSRNSDPLTLTTG